MTDVTQAMPDRSFASPRLHVKPLTAVISAIGVLVRSTIIHTNTANRNQKSKDQTVLTILIVVCSVSTPVSFTIVWTCKELLKNKSMISVFQTLVLETTTPPEAL